jgi:hypothetical protein
MQLLILSGNFKKHLNLNYNHLMTHLKIKTKYILNFKKILLYLTLGKVKFFLFLINIFLFIEKTLL